MVGIMYGKMMINNPITLLCYPKMIMSSKT